MIPDNKKSDPSRPSPGRIYDYLLDGQYNYESDRQAAEQAMKLVPWLKRFVQLQRHCLQDLSVELTYKRGFDVVIDFGSGLPTQDNIHSFARPGTTVIYSDRDPIVIAESREILGPTPNVYYLEADACQPELLLNSPQVRHLIGDKRDVALVYWGFSTYMTDEELAHAASALYEWSGPKACWVFNAQGSDINLNDPRVREVHATWRKMGTPVHPRSLKLLEQLLHPWHPDILGFTSLLEWHNLPRDYLSEEDRMSLGLSGGGYGAYLIK